MAEFRTLFRGRSENTLSVISDADPSEDEVDELYGPGRKANRKRMEHLERKNAKLQEQLDLKEAREREARHRKRPTMRMTIVDGIHGMEFLDEGRRTFVQCDERGPVNVIQWGSNLEAELTMEKRDGLMAKSMSEWMEYELTVGGQSWIRQARERREEAELYLRPQDPCAPIYQELRDRPLPVVTRRVNVAGVDDQASTENQPDQIQTAAEVHPAAPTAEPPRRNPRRKARDGPNPKVIWEKRLSEAGRRDPSAPTDEEMVKHVWDTTMRSLTVEVMGKWMKLAMIATVPDGTKTFPIYTDGLMTQLRSKPNVVAHVTRWLNASAVNGNPPFANLYKQYGKTGKIQQLQELEEQLPGIEQNLNIGATSNLDPSVTKHPEVGQLQTTVNEINAGLNDDVLSNHEEYTRQMNLLKQPGWEEMPTDQIWEEVGKEKKLRLKSEAEKDKLKEQMAYILVDRTFEDSKNNARDAMENMQLESLRREAMALDDKVQQSAINAAELQEEQAELVEGLQEDLDIEKRARKGLSDQLAQKEKLILDLNNRITPKNQEGANRGTIDTNFDADDGIYGGNFDSFPGSAFKRNGKSVVLTNYPANVEMRGFDKLPKVGVWWTNIMNSQPKCPKTGFPMIPPIVRTSMLQVESRQLGLIQMIQTNTKESRDLHFNLGETAKVMLKHGVHHDLLAPLFCDHILPVTERPLVATIKGATSELDVLLKYINSKTNRITGTEKAETAAKDFLNKDMMKKNPDLRVTIGRLKEYHGLEIVRTYHDYEQMTPEQIEAHKESIARMMFTNELKLNHKQSWDEAIKLGYNNQGVEEIAESMQGIFHVNSKNRKVYVATKADRREKAKQPARKTEKKTERKPPNKPPKKKVNNLTGTQAPRRQESRPQRPTYTAKPGAKKDFKKGPRKVRLDPSRLRSIPGSSDKLWDSKDGTVTDVRLPCDFHKARGASAEQCLTSQPMHCFECSKPGKIAPPVRECTGRHQYRAPAPKRRFEGRRQ